MDYTDEEKEYIKKYQGSLDTCECNHIRLQHIEGERCIWCSCSRFKKRIVSNSNTQNK